MARIEPLAAGMETPEVRQVFDRIRSRGDQPSPLYRTLARAPALLDGWATYAAALRSDTSVDRSVKELVIMRLAQLTNGAYQWAYHWKPALLAGLNEAQLRNLTDWRGSADFTSLERDALAYAEAMFAGAVTDGDLIALDAHFTTQEILELTLTIGFYINVGRVLQAMQVDVDPSHEAFLP